MMKVLSLLALIPSAFGSDTSLEAARDLQQFGALTDWVTTVNLVNGQTFDFTTGPGNGANPNVKITVTDVCRSESATRADLGELYPSNNVVGINSAVTGGGPINPGSTAAVTLNFVEGINGNTDIYTQDNVANTAAVSFCAVIGLYDDTTLIDFAEIKLNYNINLVTNFAELTGYTVTQAELYTGGDTTAISFDGTIEAYFCEPVSKTALTNDGSTVSQGSIINVCFRVPDGQFEVSSVTDLSITNLVGGGPTQDILTAGAVSAGTPYALAECTDVDGTDTNVCIVSFLLRAEFFDNTALTLTGSGSLLLELGDATGNRRLVRRRLQTSTTVDGSGQEPISEEFTVQASQFNVEQVETADEVASVAPSTFSMMAAFGAVIGTVALVL